MASASPPPDDPDANLLYRVHDGVAWLTLNRPRARNALNAPLRSALWAAFRRFGADTSARIAVLCGNGPVFCAGGDLKEMAAQDTRVPPADYVPQLNRTLHLEKPVIAAVQGGAFGGGFLLAQMADLCIATESARFGITEARWGRGAPWAAPLPWLIPPRAALEILMTAEPVDADRARELGLVNRVVPDGDLRKAAAACAATIAANAPLSVQAAKAMVYGAGERTVREALDYADTLYEPVYHSRDAQEGPRAFRERRPPRWEGL